MVALMTLTPGWSQAQASHETGGISLAGAVLPTGRARSAAVGITGTAYVFGGNDGSALDAVLAYSPATDSLTQISVKLPSGRYGSSAATDGRSAYVFGGRNHTSFFDEIAVFDPDAPSLRVDGGRLPTARAFTSAVWTGSTALVFGGLGPSGPLDSIVQYDPGTGVATTLEARLPYPLFDASAIWDGEAALIFGGFDNVSLRREVLRFDPAVGAVTTMGARLPSARDQTSAVWNGANAYVYGGGTGTLLLREVLRYSPSSDTFFIMAEKLPSGRDQSSAAWVGNRALVFGGFGGLMPLSEIVRHEPPNQAPVAAFDHLTRRLAATVDASDSTDPDGSIVSYSWDWGDGSDPGLGVTATHDYESEGTYAVALTVRDGAGASAKTSKDIVVSSVNQSPVADFRHTTRALVAKVDASSATDFDGAIVSYEWRWGDSSAAGMGVITEHSFPEPGTYAVTLKVIDDEGLSSTVVRDVAVSKSNFPPTPAFVAAVDGLAMTVDASASSDTDGRIVSYSWNWSDGTPDGAGRSTAHRFGSPGAYTVTLQVTDDAGAIGVSSQSAVVEGVGEEPDESGDAPVFALVGFALEPEKPLRGDSVVARLTISNQGNATGTATVRLRVNDSVYDVRLVTLPAGETLIVRFKGLKLEAEGLYRFESGIVGGPQSQPITVDVPMGSKADPMDEGLKTAVPNLPLEGFLALACACAGGALVRRRNSR